VVWESVAVWPDLDGRPRRRGPSSS